MNKTHVQLSQALDQARCPALMPAKADKFDVEMHKSVTSWLTAYTEACHADVLSHKLTAAAGFVFQPRKS